MAHLHLQFKEHMFGGSDIVHSQMDSQIAVTIVFLLAATFDYQLFS